MASSHGLGDSAFGDAPSGVVVRLRCREYDLLSKPALLEELAPANTASEVTIDCAMVDYMDSTAINCLIHLKNRMAETSSKPIIRLIAVKPQVARIFSITGLSALFEIITAK